MYPKIHRVDKEEKFADLLSQEINNSKNGKKKFATSFNDWKAEVYAKWSSRNVNLIITSRVPKFHITFDNCSIKKALLISLIARYDNYKLSGSSSPVSDLLLQDLNSRSLLKGRKASFKLKDKSLIYSIQLKKNDRVSLSNVFTLLHNLTRQIDLII